MSVEPLCPVYTQCGGCQYQHLSYDEELLIKERYVKEALSSLHLADHVFHPILQSPQQYYYRNRLDLKLHRFRNGDISIGFSPQGSKKVLSIDQCPIARGEINNYIATVKHEAIARLTAKYRQANLVIRSGEQLKPAWGGVGKKSLLMKEEDYFVVTIEGYKIYYSLETFFQANLSILPDAIKAIRGLPIWNKDAVFFDLYGGVGLFGIGVYDLVRHVVNIEENPASIKLAQYNKKANNLLHYDCYAGRVEDVLPKLLPAYDGLTKIVMVDPPRAGLTDAAVEWINGLKSVDYLLYLSCHPDSLINNLEKMKDQWQIMSIMPFDFFPRTRHVETLVLLKPHAIF